MKRGLLCDKKGDEDFLSSKVVFLVLNAIFIIIVMLFLSRIARGTTLVEQTYAKQIALIIDQAKPGTSIELNIAELCDLADKNYFERVSTVTIDNEAKKVIVRATGGKGYSFNFFSNSAILWKVDKISKKLILEVKESGVSGYMGGDFQGGGGGKFGGAGAGGKS